MYTLLLRLGAPLQSWGSSSLYNQRETDYMPTKSGVIGLVAAALGRGRGESIEDLNTLNFGVRIDSPGIRLNDYQVTNMGEKLNANISNRVYLSDALFLAGLSCDDEEFLDLIETAIKNPVFPLFLGRRSCPGTLPISLGVKSMGLYDALSQEPWLLPEWRKREAFRFNDTLCLRIVTDAEEASEGIKKDVPVSYSPFKREYRYRYITERDAKIVHKAVSAADMPGETNNIDAAAITHDPMKELG